MRHWLPNRSTLLAGWLLGLLLGLSSSAAVAQRAVVLVRHGEKLDSSPQALLSAAGHDRARRLADLLLPLGIRAIFVSEVRRTAQTAQPLADRLALPLTPVAAADRTALLARLHALPKDAAALVVGHADTLPLLLADLGVGQPIDLAPSDFGSLFILIPAASGPPTLLRLRY